MKKIVLQDPKNIIALRRFAIIRSFMTVMVLFLFAFHSSGQVAINEDDSDADADAALDIKSTTKGVIFPKLSETERDTLPSPATGLLIYNRTVGYFNYYNGNKWCRIERSVAIDPATNPSGSENDNGTGVGIEDPDNSAILHVNSNAKGFLMPRLTADISSTTEGMIYHNNNYFRFYNGTEWTDIAGPVEGDGDTGTADAEGVVIGKSSIDQSAKMEVYSADKGLLIPRMTSTQRNDINSPAEGLLIYNTDDHAFQYYADSKWYSWVNDLSEYGTENYPGVSCADILSKRPSASDGNYWIDPDSTAGSIDPFECQCDMTTDGGGWITLELDKTNQIYIHSNSSSNNVYKGGDDGDGEEIDNYNHIATEFSNENCGGYGGDHTITLNYINPATGGNFTTEQLNGIRGIIDQLSSTTRMIALTCDDDGQNPGHVVGIYDVDDNYIELSVGESGNDIWGAWRWNTSAGGGSTTLGSTGTNDPSSEWPDLPVEYIIPSKVILDENTGGGMMWGYEDAQFLVK